MVKINRNKAVKSDGIVTKILAALNELVDDKINEIYKLDEILEDLFSLVMCHA